MLIFLIPLETFTSSGSRVSQAIPSVSLLVMDCLKGLLSCFRDRPMPIARRTVARRTVAERSVVLKPLIFSRLPMEILLHIVDYLPASSAASFSLSCLQIERLIGDQCIKSLADSFRNTSAFLNLLERDLPDQVACSSCNKLHKMENARRYTEHGRRPWPAPVPACLSDDRCACTTLYIHPGFSSAIFRMAMKHYHQNLECAQLLKLLSKSVETTSWNGHTRQYTAECRIFNSSLFIRKQMAFHVLPRFSHIGWDLSFWICPHLKFETTAHSVYVCTSFPVRFKKTWTKELCFNNIIDEEIRDVSSGLMRCHHCRTEYQIDFKHYVNHGTVVFNTRWKDLGSGPDDEIWKAHIKPQNYLLIPRKIRFGLGELSSAFQQGEPFKFDSLLTPNNTEALFQRNLSL
jgi:hypothetical protein